MGTPPREHGKITHKTRDIFDEAESMLSELPDWVRTMASAPRLLESFWGFYTSVIRSSVISREVRHMIALDVASTDGCKTCAGGYRNMIRQAGFSDQIIRDIENKVSSKSLEEKAQDILVFSYALSKDPHDFRATTIEAFRKKLTDEEMVETVVTVNLFRSVLETIHGLALHDVQADLHH